MALVAIPSDQVFCFQRLVQGGQRVLLLVAIPSDQVFCFQQEEAKTEIMRLMEVAIPSDQVFCFQRNGETAQRDCPIRRNPF